MREALRWLIVIGLAAAPAQARSIALVSFGEAAQEVEQPVRGALGNIGGVRLSTAAHTAADVEAARQIGLACGPQSDECLVKLALFLRVDQLVSLAATRTAEGLSLELILVDAELGRRAGEVAFTLGAEGRAAQLDDAALLLLVPDQAFGVVVLDVVPADARVSVDDAAPVTAAQLRLRAGEHTIEVSQHGYHSERQTLTVRPASTTAISIALTRKRTAPPTLEPPAPALFWPGVVVASIGGGAVLVGTAAALVLDDQLRTPGVIVGAQQREDTLAIERIAAGVAAVGALLATTGGVMLMLE